MNERVLTIDNSTSKGIHLELKRLADSLNEIIRGIRVAQEPIAESRSKVPQAAEQLEKITQQTEDAAHRVLDMVESITGREGDIEKQLKELKRVLPTTYFRGESRVKKLLDSLLSNASANQNDAYAIMNALQFQDITSQQIDHAISLLEQVENRLKDVMINLQAETVGEVETGKKKQRAYDPNASFSSDATKQVNVDELVNDLVKQKQIG